MNIPTKKSIISDLINMLGKPPVAAGIIIFITLFVSFFSWTLHKNFKKQVITQNHEKLLSIIQATGKSFEEHIASHHGILEMISSNPFIKEGIINNVQGKAWDGEKYQLQSMFKTHSNDIDAIYLLSSTGQFIHRYPQQENVTRDFSPMPGVAEVIANRKPHLSNIFRNPDGGYSISILQPVFLGERFIGIVRSVIHMDKLINQFLQPHGIGNKGQFLLFDDDGYIYSHPNEQYIGTNIRKLIKYHDKGDEIKEAAFIEMILQGSEGSSTLLFDEMFSIEACYAWTFISKDPELSGYARIKIDMTGRNPKDRAFVEKEAKLIKSSLNKLIPKKNILSSPPLLNEKIDRLLADYPDIEEIEVYENIPENKNPLKILHKKKIDENEGYAAASGTVIPDDDLIKIRLKDFAIRDDGASIVLTSSIYTSTKIWPIAVALPHDDIVNPINRNALNMFFLSFTTFLMTLAVGYIVIYSRNQKTIMEDHNRHLVEMNKKSEELRKSEAVKRELEEKLTKSEKMQSLGQLAGEVAHDLNNVLSGIVSYPDFLLSRLMDNDPMAGHIEIIKKSGEKAAAIVQDMLTLTRRGVVKTEVLSLNSIITDNLNTPEYMKLKSYHPGVIIKLNLDLNINNMRGSQVHIGKSIMNLISNSHEAIHERGEIIISTGMKEFEDKISCFGKTLLGSFSAVSVSDSGKGIDSGDIMRIFEPFYTKKIMGRSGTGLGMTVVWGTLYDHDGHIEVVSSEGRGTVITLFFPDTEEKIPEKEKINIENFRGNGETILVVDDMEGQRQIASAMLSSLGYHVETAGNMEEALASFSDRKADLVILDMILERDADGLDVFQKIIEISPGQKVLIASGFSETERVLKAQELGAGDYIKKPYTLEKIAMAVKAMLKGK